jgi:hypothetical protein
MPIPNNVANGWAQWRRLKSERNFHHLGLLHVETANFQKAPAL